MPRPQKVNMKIHNNVLKDEEHKALVRYVTSNGFTWNYNDATDRPGAMNDTPQMVRALMARASLEDWQEEPSHYTSQHFYHKYFWQIPYLHDILKNCGSTGEYWRVKLNLLQPYHNAPEHHPFHIDIEQHGWQAPGGFTSYVYYINDSDGDTWFEDGTRHTPKANTAIEFGSHIKHASSNPTKGPRYVINFITTNTPLRI